MKPQFLHAVNMQYSHLCVNFSSELVISYVWLMLLFMSINHNWQSHFAPRDRQYHSLPWGVLCLNTRINKRGRKRNVCKMTLPLQGTAGWESLFHLSSASRDRSLTRPNAPHSACGALWCMVWRSSTRKQMSKSSSNEVLLARNPTVF